MAMLETQTKQEPSKITVFFILSSSSEGALMTSGERLVLYVHVLNLILVINIIC